MRQWYGWIIIAVNANNSGSNATHVSALLQDGNMNGHLNHTMLYLARYHHHH
jgi:hypothetical protein